jgi:hypothetical protein
MFVFVVVFVVNIIVCERHDNNNVVPGSNCLSSAIELRRWTRKSGFDLNNFISIHDNNNDNDNQGK